MDAGQTPKERMLAELIVESLNLEDLAPEEIEPEVQLFGSGYGLDSIDALELAVAISQACGVQIRADDDKTQHAFTNLRSLSDHIESLRE